MKTLAPRTARRLGRFAAAMAMSTALVGALAPAAFAHERDTGDGATAAGHRRPRLTDEQQACLEDQGVDKPAVDENGERVRPTQEEREAFRAAAEACGIDLPVGRHPRLTDAQRACLEEQGVEKPQREDGERTEPTDEQRAAFRAAAGACGIDLPGVPPPDSDAS